MSILGGLAAPDGSGNVYPNLFSAKATNDLWKGQCFVFKDTSTKDSLALVFKVPKNYVGTPKLVITWGTVVTSGNVEWETDYRAIAAAESLDPTTWQETVASGAVAVPGTTLLSKETSLALTGGNFSVDDLVLLHLSRKGSSGNDTAADDVEVLDVEFEYADA